MSGTIVLEDSITITVLVAGVMTRRVGEGDDEEEQDAAATDDEDATTDMVLLSLVQSMR